MRSSLHKFDVVDIEPCQFVHTALLSDRNQGPFRAIIVDSIISLFRVEFSGRGELSERQQKLGQHLAQVLSQTNGL